MEFSSSLAFALLLMLPGILEIFGLHCLNFAEFDFGILPPSFALAILTLRHGWLEDHSLEVLPIILNWVLFRGDSFSAH